MIILILKNFIKNILPSARTKKDPLRVMMHDDSNCPYQPIPINDIKLTHLMRHKFNKIRRRPAVVSTPSYNKKLGVIVAYRNREEHLNQFPQHLKNFLANQDIDHKILVVEQSDDKFFNRGKLCNLGAKLMTDECDYFCFHDVDMLPETASYAYINHPVLLANSVSQFDGSPEKPQQLWEKNSSYFGGVVLFRKEEFIKINGFSNNYWHWGYEDDDLFIRCLQCDLTPLAYTKGRYLSLPHEKAVTATDNDKFDQYLRNKKRYKKMRRGLIDLNQDGLNNINYTLINQEVNKLYSKVSVTL